MKIAIIGGGAAGFFAAISAKTNHPDAEVIIYEKTLKILSKVKVSGGGRCNVTNGCDHTKQLLEGYPRGKKILKKLFRKFNNQDTINWFQSRGVNLKTESDGRVFPTSNDAQSIIDCLLKETKKLGIQIATKMQVEALIPENNSSIKITFKNNPALSFDFIIITTGGSPKRSGYNWLEELGHRIIEPVPSLFTFNMPTENITDLMGVVVQDVVVSIPGEKLKSSGPLLITHWGMSGPAILKLSAFGARRLYDNNYSFKISINWISERNNDLILDHLSNFQSTNSKKNLTNAKPYPLPDRLWIYFIKKMNLSVDQKWGELGIKSLNKLIHILSNDIYDVSGKTTFKEEFVTCGGISLESIHSQSLQSASHPRIYFAGEVLDIDGITGGYNFQAAWTTGFIAGQLYQY